MQRTTRTRRGVALLWALVFIAILAALTVAVAPSLMHSDDVERVQSAATMLKRISTGVYRYAAAMSRTGTTGPRESPGLLTQLENTVVAGDPVGCTTGPTVNANAASHWADSMPYTTIYIPPAGLWTPIGRLNPSPATRSATSYLYDLQIPNVSTQDAQLLDVLVDGVAGSAADTVRYTTPVNGLTTVSYRVFFNTAWPSVC